jgi:hypothetical protein
MPLSMAGMDLTFPVDVEVEVRNLPADGTPVEVLTAASAVGLRNLRHAPVSGMELPSGKIVKFTFSNGTLMAQLAFEQGFKMVIR